MIKPSDKDVDSDEAYNRVVTRMTDGFDNAACIAIMIGFDRETFVKAAGMAFDFIKKWHDYKLENRTKGTT